MSNEANEKPQKNTKYEAKEQRKRPTKNKAKKKDDNVEVDRGAQSAPQIDSNVSFKNLKRETEEIHEPTNEANAKYNKKQIQSNWHKYEIQPENNEQLEEQQYLGADYEQLSQMPLSVGNHFQFKHEKSWDSAVALSEFDKYFNTNLSSLSLAINSIPFYERNSIDRSIFFKGDYSNMDHNAKRNKLKYDAEKLLKVNEASQIMVNKEAVEEMRAEIQQSLNKSLLLEVIGEKEIKDFGGGSGMASTNSAEEDIVSKLSDETQELVPQAVLHDQHIVLHNVFGAGTNSDEPLQNKAEMQQEESSRFAPKDLEKWLDDFLT